MDDNEKKRKKQEKAKRMLEELKNNANGLSEEDLKSLEELIVSLEEASTMDSKKVFLMGVLEFIKSFIVSYLAGLFMLGFFVSYLTFSNRLFAFLVPIPVATILALFEVLPLPNIFKYHIGDYILVFALIMASVYLINTYCLTIFSSSLSLIFYFLLSEAFTLLINVWLIKVSLGGKFKL